MKEVLIYEFDDVPVVIGKMVLRPFFNMKYEGLSKDVNEWIGWLSNKARKFPPLDPSSTLCIVIWNTGWGTYEYIGKYDT